jgi:hypothetical protein
MLGVPVKIVNHVRGGMEAKMVYRCSLDAKSNPGAKLDRQAGHLENSLENW